MCGGLPAHAASRPWGTASGAGTESLGVRSTWSSGQNLNNINNTQITWIKVWQYSVLDYVGQLTLQGNRQPVQWRQWRRDLTKITGSPKRVTFGYPFFDTQINTLSVLERWLYKRGLDTHGTQTEAITSPFPQRCHQSPNTGVRPNTH